MIVTVKPSEGTLPHECPECHLTCPGFYRDTETDNSLTAQVVNIRLKNSRNILG